MNEQRVPYRVACYTLGCKVNGYESQAMLEQFERAGWTIVEADQAADVYLVNTCTVTQIAAHKSRQILNRIARLNPDALVVACGCYVDQKERQQEPLGGACGLIVTNREKPHIVQLVEARLDLPADEGRDFYISSSGAHTRAFLKVQDGCRQFCSYCIIPYVRGPLVSKPLEQAMQEARMLSESGCREIVLTGIHLSSYGRDLPEDIGLADLILALEAVEGLDRIRLGSLEVGLIDDAFIARVRDCRKLCPHFHLSLQSGCEKTLKAMNRRYTPDQFMEAVQRIRAAFPDAAITTDVITGFPGETDKDFEESLQFVHDVSFADLHVFPYSPREGTAAAQRKDQIDKSVKQERSSRMIELGAALQRQFGAAYSGKDVEVLTEEYDPEQDVWVGYTPNYLRVHVHGMIQRNQLIPVHIENVHQTNNGIYAEGFYDER
ncbi:MAG: tRNA (N(6)-L-threonylcarbamoyladenosine(37)-C(2))-methylthiotransferase MtaB [Clostridiales bacterium]|nr:tRNA (N(6)-L-threonylcarbamoyladenosine(37)-C(2))-methylthiotransferase MtaB [Clostridiales bacterium]